MANIEQNREAWNKDWQDHGETWSEAWGGVESQWFGTIFPRVHAFLPTVTILEIAPGYGRWTQFLKNYCDHLILVDLSEKCIKACKKDFHSYSHISYYVNDGKSLSMIQNHSIDFVFSFDALVHTDADVIEAYLSQLARIFKLNGVGFIHHSNIGACVNSSTGQFPPDFINPHWRAENMTAKLFEEFCRKANLKCITQEIINWGGYILNDCFSLCTPIHSVWARPNKIFINEKFMNEVQYLSRVSQLYTISSFKNI